MEQTKQKVTSAVTETLSVGMDTIEKTVDYVPYRRKKAMRNFQCKRGQSLNAKGIIIDSTLQYVYKIWRWLPQYEKKELATSALKEKYVSTEVC